MPKLEVAATLVFLYYKDLAKACAFYQDVLGLEQVIDQAWCKIFRITPHSMVGLVDGENGTHKPGTAKPVILSFVTPDVDGWYAHLLAQGVTIFKPLKTSESIGVRGFMALDTEGYTLEFESFTRPKDRAAAGLIG